MFEISPESVFKFIKYCVTFTCAWPPNKNARKRDIIIFEIKWWILWFNCLFITIFTTYTLYSYRQNIFRFTECFLFAQIFLQINLKMCFCNIEYKRMQFFFDEMQNYFRNASSENREIFEAYVKKYGIANFAFLAYTFWCTVAVVLGPLFSTQPFPLEITYLFKTDSTPIFQIIYMQQMLVACQVVSGIGIDNQISTMIWCVVIRFEILRKEISEISNTNEFKMGIQKHQYLLWLASETVKASKYVIFITLISSVLTVILSGILVIGNQPIMIRVTSMWLLLARCLLLFLIALPSEHLQQSCDKISSAIYECTWTNSNFKKNIAFVIFRSNKPITISIAGFIPKLSLNYYAMFLSKSFSFFTTLRIVFAKMEMNAPE